LFIAALKAIFSVGPRGEPWVIYYGCAILFFFLSDDIPVFALFLPNFVESESLAIEFLCL
jgi:hypothetical protein